MKSITCSNIVESFLQKELIFFCCFFILLISDLLYAQNPAPVLGPPIPTDNEVDVLRLEGGLFMIHERIVTKIDSTIIDQNKNNKDFTIVGWSFERKRPIVSKTKLLNFPNQHFVLVDYDLLFDLIIYYKGQGYPFNRKVKTTLHLAFFCNNWEIGEGKLTIIPSIDRFSVITDYSLFEEALVGFLSAGHGISAIEDVMLEKINELNLGNLQKENLPLKCNCLGSYFETKFPSEDGVKFFDDRIMSKLPMPKIMTNISIVKVKRIQHSFTHINTPEIASIGLIGNYNLAAAASPDPTDFSEGQEKIFSTISTRVISLVPENRLLLIVSANVSTHNDFFLPVSYYGFLLINDLKNFKNETALIIINKITYLPPKFINGKLTKPSKHEVPYYEVTVKIDKMTKPLNNKG